MSAKVRSLLSLLSRPFGGRRLPARVVAPIIVLLAALGVAAFMWSKAKAQDYGDPPLDFAATYDEVRRLRTEVGDNVGARDLAAAFLDEYATIDADRQLMHYEYAAALFCNGESEASLTAFGDVVDLYAGLGLADAADASKVDDALFFVAHLSQDAGDVETAATAFARLGSEMPYSNRAISALTRLSEIEEHANIDAVLTQVDNIVQLADASDDVEWRFNMHVDRAQLLRMVKRYADSYAEFFSVYNAFPEHERRAAVLKEANSVLYEHERYGFRRVDGKRVHDDVDYIDTYEANVQTMLAAYRDTDDCLNALECRAGYYLNRLYWRPDQRPFSLQRILDTADLMEQIDPDADQTKRVSLVAINAIGRDDPALALTMAEEARLRFQASGEAWKENDAMIVKARHLSLLGRREEARAIWNEILSERLDAFTPHIALQVEAELRRRLAASYVLDGDEELTFQQYDLIADNEQFPDNTRAIGLSSKANYLWARQRPEEAAVVAREAVHLYPDVDGCWRSRLILRALGELQD